MSRTERFAHGVTGAVLALVSTGALVLLLASLPMGRIETLMAGAAGVALQGCLYLFARGSGMTCRTLSVVLLAVSVAASVAFMEQAWRLYGEQARRQQVQAGDDDFLVRQLKQQLDSLQQAITVRLATAERDTGGRYTTRGLDQLDTVRELEQQRGALLQQLRQSRQQAGDTAADGSLQALLDGAPRPVRLGVFSLLAVLVDLCALAALNRVRPVPESVTGKDCRSTETDDTPLPQQEDGRCPIEQVEARILAGDFGNPPSKRMAESEIQQAFERLAEKGRLVKTGQRFELVEP